MTRAISRQSSRRWGERCHSGYYNPTSVVRLTVEDEASLRGSGVHESDYASDRRAVAAALDITTLSNCGDLLRASITKQRVKALCGQGSDLGYSNIVEDVTMEDPQPTPTSLQIWRQLND